MAEYITLPVEVDPAAIFAAFVAYIQTQWPDWEPADGNLDSWLAQAIANDAAELREIVYEVPTTIFRYYGATIANIPPNDATPAYALTNWTVINNVGYTIPAGTQLGIAADGNDTIPFETVSDIVIPAGATVANNVQIVATEEGAAGSNLGAPGTPVELNDTLDYILSITLVGATSGGTDAEDDDAYLNRLTNELQLLSPRPILPNDFAVLARTIAGITRAVALDGYNPAHNYLTANASSIETDATGWVNDTNIAVSRVTTDAADGVASLQMSSVAAGTMVTRSAQAIAVLPGETWTALASVKAGTIVRSVKASIRWYSDVGGTVLISTSDGAAANDSLVGYTAYTVTAQAPPTALSARVIITVTATGGAAEIHRADKMSLRRGSTTDWVIGGTAETGNTKMIAIAAVDENGSSVSSAIKAQIQALLQGAREVNFIVSVIDPNYTAVDVNVTVHPITGYDPTIVDNDVTAAIQAYLSPANWGKDVFVSDSTSDPGWNNIAIIRLFELAQVINNVPGVDYIVSGTLQQRYGANAFAAGDVTLPGAIPLPTAGVINVAVA